MKEKIEQFQVTVIGGGLAGLSAAVAAARMGNKTCLIQNRPVLGGNSSSEIRVTPHGACAFHAYARETGIISELIIEERAQNHEPIFENGWTNSVWDMVLYNMVQNTPNLNLYLNTDVYAISMDTPSKIKSIQAKILNAETNLSIHSEIFIDCSGDGIVAALSGCNWRLGSESKEEFSEPHAPEKASNDVMGSSIHFKTKDTGKPVTFNAPDWAIKYDDAGFFYNEGRFPKEKRGGYWWIEIGVPFDTINDNEIIRHELTRHALGVWDWMKNKDSKMKLLTENYALDWIGQVPGKRESRRIMGEYLMTEHDPTYCTVFEDEIAFGGWFIDLHTPGGLLAKLSEPASSENYSTFTDYAVKSYVGPYGIPLRCLIAKDMENLMMAGRNVSVTHAALGTVRVMNTTALMGQAAGTAAALSIQLCKSIKETSISHIHNVQQILLRNGCFLPNYRNQDSKDHALQATLTASSEAVLEVCTPDSPSFDQGLKIWRDQPQYISEKLETAKGQLIAVGCPVIDSIEVLFNNTSDAPQTVLLQLKKVDHIWDYRINGLDVLANISVVVPIGKNWIELKVELTNLEPGKLIRLDAGANPHIEWVMAGNIEAGLTAVYQIGDNKMRRFGNGHSLSFKIKPAQPCFNASNVINGVTRPHQYTNLWKSDPSMLLPQWIQLSWKEARCINQVELTFPGHLLREYHAYDPFYRDPQCPSDYTIDAMLNDNWVVLKTIKGNYQRQNVHVLDNEIITSKVRVTILATNGDPSAQVYEIRCY
jgi:hypothetical protein